MVGRRKVGPRSGPCSILPFEEQQGELDLREVLKEKKDRSICGSGFIRFSISMMSLIKRSKLWLLILVEGKTFS